MLDSETERKSIPGSCGSSPSRTLPELAIMCLYCVLVSLVTIVKRCNSAFVPVPSAAPRRGVCGTTYGTSRSSVRTESIHEHNSIVTGIGAEHDDATSALSDALPALQGARDDLTFATDASNVLKSAVGRCTHFRLSPTAAR